jgi:hypothetical protein
MRPLQSDPYLQPTMPRLTRPTPQVVPPAECNANPDVAFPASGDIRLCATCHRRLRREAGRFPSWWELRERNLWFGEHDLPPD